MTKWIVDSHIWISLGAVGLSIFTLEVIGERPELGFVGLIFAATCFVYNLQTLLKWNRRFKDSAKRSVVGLKTTKIITIICGIAMIALSFQLEAEQVVLVGILGLISVFYAARMKITEIALEPFSPNICGTVLKFFLSYFRSLISNGTVIPRM